MPFLNCIRMEYVVYFRTFASSRFLMERVVLRGLKNRTPRVSFTPTRQYEIKKKKKMGRKRSPQPPR